jgi:hypothetical protein
LAVADENRLIYCDVDADEILKFLREYRFHEKARDLRPDLIRGYIEAQNRNGELRRWNVGVITRKASAAEERLDLGPGVHVPLLRRSRVADIGGDQYANLGVIMSNADMVADLPVERETAARTKSADLQKMRPKPNGPGLLLLYPIDRKSEPAASQASASKLPRRPLDAVEHVLGVGLVFPRSSVETPQRYKTVDLSRVDREELEVEPEETEEEDAA